MFTLLVIKRKKEILTAEKTIFYNEYLNKGGKVLS